MQICGALDSLIERDDGSEADGEGEGTSFDHAASNGMDERMDIDGDRDDLLLGSDDHDDDDMSDDSEESSDEDDGDDEEINLGETSVSLRDPSDEEDADARRPIRKGPRHPVLDDGFFSIDDFNRQTELMEAKRRSSGRLGKKDEGDDSSDDEEEGIDFFAPMDGGAGVDDDDQDSDLQSGSDEDSDSDGSGDSQDEEGSEEEDGEDELGGIGGGLDLTGMNGKPLDRLAIISRPELMPCARQTSCIETSSLLRLDLPNQKHRSQNVHSIARGRGEQEIRPSSRAMARTHPPYLKRARRKLQPSASPIPSGSRASRPAGKA